mgnify:FL=1
MINVDERKIIVHRGDTGEIAYSIDVTDEELYEFKVGDKIEFTVFEKNGYDKTPVLYKEIEVEKVCTEVKIPLTKKDMTIGEPQNKPKTYWYEISLNGVDTTNGYDYEEGAAELILLPAKGDE